MKMLLPAAAGPLLFTSDDVGLAKSSIALEDTTIAGPGSR
jgi:hypothetical protein